MPATWKRIAYKDEVLPDLLAPYAVGDLLYASSTSALAKLADVAVGSYLRSGGVTTAPLWSTLILPNAATAYRLPVATGTNTIGELAAVGATGEYLKGNTGAIPSWATLNQAAVAGLTTADGPSFAHLHLADAAAIYTAAESWIGPSSTDGVYFKSGNAGFGEVVPTSKIHVKGSVSTSGPGVFGLGHFLNTYNNYDTNPTVTYPVASFTRDGKVATTYGSVMQIGIARYENSGSASRTQVDFMLAHGDTGYGEMTALRLKSNGIVTMPGYGAGTATFDASGNISSVSDEKMKVVLHKYEGGIDKLMGIEPIIYKWNQFSGMETRYEYVGFGARNVQKSMPEAVYKHKETGILSYTDKAIMAALVNAAKQHEAQIQAIQAQIQAIQAQLN